MSLSYSTSVKANKVTSSILYTSDFCELKSWQYDFQHEQMASKGYNDCLCIVYVKSGNFFFDISRNSYDMYSGHLVIDKPDYEYQLRPATGECTIFNFTDSFYRQLVDDCSLNRSFFFSSPNLLSLMVKSSPEIDYLHFQILNGINQAGKLEIDNYILDFVKSLSSIICNQSLDFPIINSSRRLHLKPIEQAKEFIHARFANDISLFDLSDHCCVSPFHFTRIFKKFTHFTPHQYLQNVRLKHGETLLRTTRWPISDIAISCGFNTVEYFATAFRNKYGQNPSQYRGKC
jgi:AraC family transcriptional regulator